jgi:hypothetical protein
MEVRTTGQYHFLHSSRRAETKIPYNKMLKGYEETESYTLLVRIAAIVQKSKNCVCLSLIPLIGIH